MNMTSREARRAEIERDHRLVSLGLLQTLETLVDEELARLMREHASAAPYLLLEQIEAVAATHREDLARLGEARLECRVANQSHANTTPLPDVLAALRHRGNYHGAFASMADLGRALGSGIGLPEAWVEPAAATALASALHRRREIWTFERSGAIHVFGTPGTTADRVLAARADRGAKISGERRAESTGLRLVSQPA